MLIIIFLIFISIGLAVLVAIPIVGTIVAQKSKLNKVDLSKLKDYERTQYLDFSNKLQKNQALNNSQINQIKEWLERR